MLRILLAVAETSPARKYIENALEIHELFNLAQMLQGENLPANIGELRRCIEEKGP